MIGDAVGDDVLQDLVLDGGEGLAVFGWDLDCRGAWEVGDGEPAQLGKEVRWDCLRSERSGGRGYGLGC